MRIRQTIICSLHNHSKIFVIEDESIHELAKKKIKYQMLTRAISWVKSTYIIVLYGWGGEDD